MHKEIDDLEVKHRSNKKVKKKAVKPPKKVKSKAQYVHWKDPYQPGSNLHRFHQAMMKKGGMTVREFNSLIKKTGAKATWILKVMRHGSSSKGWAWDFDDSRDRYRVTNCRKTRKEK